MTGKEYVDNHKAAISDLLFNLIRRAQKVTVDGRLEFGSQIDEIAGWIADAYEAGYKIGRFDMMNKAIDGCAEESENDR